MTLKDFITLTKLRLCLLALLMACLGFFIVSVTPIPLYLFLSMLGGLALVGFSSGVLNQYIEIDYDRKMRRTQNRPLVIGTVSKDKALYLGIALGTVGIALLLFLVNPLTAALGAVTLFTYLAMYTPMKRMNSLSTIMGAIPGALPPLMGYTAYHNEMGWPGILLFFIIFCWQIPHFLAISWLYREEYQKAGFKVLPVVDPEGRATANQILLYTLILLPLTLVPYVKGLSGIYYFWTALALGIIFLVLSSLLAFKPTHKRARILFFYSITYLPILGGVMLWNKY